MRCGVDGRECHGGAHTTVSWPMTMAKSCWGRRSLRIMSSSWGLGYTRTQLAKCSAALSRLPAMRCDAVRRDSDCGQHALGGLLVGLSKLHLQKLLHLLGVARHAQALTQDDVRSFCCTNACKYLLMICECMHYLAAWSLGGADQLLLLELLAACVHVHCEKTASTSQR